MANLYNAEGYVSPTEYAAFTRIEKAERAAGRTEFDSRLHTNVQLPHVSYL